MMVMKQRAGRSGDPFSSPGRRFLPGRELAVCPVFFLSLAPRGGRYLQVGVECAGRDSTSPCFVAQRSMVPTECAGP